MSNSEDKNDANKIYVMEGIIVWMVVMWNGLFYPIWILPCLLRYYLVKLSLLHLKNVSNTYIILSLDIYV